VVSIYNPMINQLITPFLLMLLLLTFSGVLADNELLEEVIFILMISSVLGMKVQTKLETKMFKPVGAGLNPLRQVGLDVVYLKSELFMSK